MSNWTTTLKGGKSSGNFDHAKALPLPWRPWSAFDVVIAATVNKILQDQLQTLLDDITLRQSVENLLSDVMWVKLSEQFLEQLKPNLIDLTLFGVEFAKDLLPDKDAIKVDWALVNLNAVERAKKYAGEQITKINDVTRKAVQREVAESINAGETIHQLADRLELLKGDNGQLLFDKVRARRIAVTENTQIFADANIAAWTALGYAKPVFWPIAHVNCRCYMQPKRIDVNNKVIVWYTAHDERVCVVEIETETELGVVKGCRELHGMIVSEGALLGQHDERFSKLIGEPENAN